MAIQRVFFPVNTVMICDDVDGDVVVVMMVI